MKGEDIAMKRDRKGKGFLMTGINKIFIKDHACFQGKVIKVGAGGFVRSTKLF